MKKPPLTHARLTERLRYDPTSGAFSWSRGPEGWIGRVAGSPSVHGKYLQIGLDGRKYYGHRLAWFYVWGEWPASRIDHRDGNGLNNAWGNLRPATQSENMRNKAIQSNNAVGLKGVSKKRKGFLAQIRVDGRNTSLGVYATAEEAHAAYCAASRVHHGEFARFA